MSSTREAYGAALAELAEKYEFFVFDADLSKATQTVHFAKNIRTGLQIWVLLNAI